MTLPQLSLDQKLYYMVPYAPFVMVVHSRKYTIAEYWQTWTTIDESKTGDVTIGSFVRDNILQYSKVETLEELYEYEKTFFFDQVDQILYVHF
jgi:hypothetical protein